MLGAADGWAAGDNTLLHWDGATWQLAVPPATAKLLGMKVLPGGGWAVGDLASSGHPRLFDEIGGDPDVGQTLGHGHEIERVDPPAGAVRENQRGRWT